MAPFRQNLHFVPLGDMEDIGKAFDQQVTACQAYLGQLDDLEPHQKIKRQSKAHSAVERVSKVTAVLRTTIRAPRDRSARTESDLMVHFGNAAERLGLLTVVLEDIEAAKESDPKAFSTCHWSNVDACHQAMSTVIGLLGDLCRSEAVADAARRIREKRDAKKARALRRFRVAARASIWYAETVAARDSSTITVTVELAPRLKEVLSNQDPQTVELVGRTTIRELKELLFKEFLVAAPRQIIQFNGTVLQDDATLASSEMSDEATVVLDVENCTEFPLQLPRFKLEDVSEAVLEGMKFEDGDVPVWSIDEETAESIGFAAYSAVLSPLVKIDLSPDTRDLAGIPRDAAWFAWSYPVAGLRPTSGGGPADACFVLTGGWLYIDESRTRIVRAACMRPAEKDATIQFSHRQAWGDGWSEQLARTGRMQRVSLRHMREVGALYFCWLNPGEVVGTDEQERVICPAAGGFAYIFNKDGSPVDDADAENPEWDKMPGCYFECEGTGADKEIVPMLPSTALGSFSHAQVALGLFGRSCAPLALSDEVFASFDKEGSGNLDVAELREFLLAAFPSFPCTDQDMAIFLEHIDQDRSGTVNITELRAFLRCYDPGASLIRKKTALIIIDVQNDFISGTLANQFNAAEIVPRINEIRDNFDVVTLSYDWHPHDHCSFVESANAGKVAMEDEPREFKFLDVVTLAGDESRPAHQQVLYVRHAVQKSWGGETHPDLIVKESDHKIFKGTSSNIDSYSAFFDNCRAKDTGLTETLSELGVTHIYIVGLVFDICVQSTALHGAEMGFQTTIIEDCTRPLSPDQVETVKKSLRANGVQVMSTPEALADASSRRECTFADWMQGAVRWGSARRTHSTLSLASHQSFRA